MRLAIGALCLIVGGGGFTVPARAEAPGPVVARTDTTYELVLPRLFAAAIEESVPGFHPWRMSDYDSAVQKGYDVTSRQLPWAVIGDFNGDGESDLVIEGYVEQECRRLCVWGAGDWPRVEILETKTCRPPMGPRGTVLMYRRPGLQFTNFDDSYTFLNSTAKCNSN